MSYLLACRAMRGYALSFFVIAKAIAATPAAAEFPVSATQMQTLGVTLVSLEKPTAISGMAYPARVVLPPNSNQIISAPFSGRVEELLVDEQQSVKVGQPLLRLSSPEYGDLQLKFLEAASQAGLADQAATREGQLFSEGIIPARRVEEANAAKQQAAARLRFAEASLRLAGVGPAAILRAGSGGNLQDVLVLRAKSAGTVALDVKAGQRVQGFDSLLRLVNTAELWLDIQLPSSRQKQALSSRAVGSITIVGREARATPMSVGAVVSDNQTVTLRARIVEGGELLRPGEAVQVRIPFAENTAGWALPLSAITRLDDKTYVFIRSPMGFVAQPVNIISSAGPSVQVTGDLKTGQQVANGAVIALKAAWLGKTEGN